MKPPTYFRIVLEEPDSGARDVVGLLHQREGVWLLRLAIEPDIRVELPVRRAGTIAELQRSAGLLAMVDERAVEERRSAMAIARREQRLRESDERKAEEAARRKDSEQAEGQQ